MRHGFVKCAAVTPELKVADTAFNAKSIIKEIEKCEEAGVKIAVFPELCITGYTCGDLFRQSTLLSSALDALSEIIDACEDRDMLVIVGLPFEYEARLYDVAAVIFNGELIGMVPKRYAEGTGALDARCFSNGRADGIAIEVLGFSIAFGGDMIFRCLNMPGLTVAVEVGTDVLVPYAPSIRHALKGATVICDPFAAPELTMGAEFLRRHLESLTATNKCGYILAGAGTGESTTDFVFAGQSIIAENGHVLNESERFNNGTVISEIDTDLLNAERRRGPHFDNDSIRDYSELFFEWELGEDREVLPMIPLTRRIEKNPFVPAVKQQRDERCEEIIRIQVAGLKKRLSAVGCTHALVGISGGLDSTLALLITCRAFDELEIPRENIITVTMPCFGTTDRTYNNACDLIKGLKTSFKEISIKAAVAQHLADIEHDIENHNVAYENAQARERTQVLMDIANDVGGMVVGTGDLSELALGWATYNGDHMSMYGVNADVPKTMVRYLVLHFAETSKDPEVADVLYDVLDTPVSPELLPPKDGKISQKTEDLVGPYELHDFFIYYALRYGFEPEKIYRLACCAFVCDYDEKTIFKWLKNFYRRFFTQQYKRSCVPDGPKVGSVGISPRGDLHMPSDACVNAWLADLEKLGVEA